MEGKTITEN